MLKTQTGAFPPRHVKTMVMSLCCGQESDIPDDLFKGIFCFFFTTASIVTERYLQLFLKIFILQSFQENLEIKSLSNAFGEVYLRNSCP